MNENQPLWTRDRQDIEDQEYKDFYKAVFKESSDPSTWSHFKTEGDAEFTGLLFVP